LRRPRRFASFQSIVQEARSGTAAGKLHAGICAGRPGNLPSHGYEANPTKRADDKRHTSRHNPTMKSFRWSHEKNAQLKVDRQISCEAIVLALESDGLLDILRHPDESKYPNQRILVVGFEGYVYLVPFVEETDYYVLETIIPSRKATKDYLGGGSKK
jgi:hypothetical protein